MGQGGCRCQLVNLFFISVLGIKNFALASRIAHFAA